MTNQPVFVYFEDDLMSRKIMEVLLVREAQFEYVYIFADTADVLDKLNQLPAQPTVIFMDIHIAPYNGFEVLDMIRGDATYDHTRIIALTASVMNEEVNMLKDAGFDGAIAKPIDQISFIDTLDRILNGDDVWVII